MKGGEEGEMGRGGRKRGKVVICNITHSRSLCTAKPTSLYMFDIQLCPYCLR